MTDIKQEISAEALKIVTGARRAAYGLPEQNFARIARLWNAHLVNCGIIAQPEDGLMPRDVAAFMRLMKEARLAKTPDHRDSYVDLVGYALCGAEVAGVAPAEPVDMQKAIRDALADPARRNTTPPPKAEPKFKVGDRVNARGEDGAPCDNLHGRIHRQEGGRFAIAWEDGIDERELWWGADDLVHVPEATS